MEKVIIDKNRIKQIVGRIELDYCHWMTPFDFNVIYNCDHYEVGAGDSDPTHYIHPRSVEVIKNSFGENAKQILEDGAKCKITEYVNNSWLVKFDDSENISDLNRAHKVAVKHVYI